MEYINIISKEQIFAPPYWHMLVILAISIIMTLSSVVHLIIVKDQNKSLRYLLCVSFCAIVFELIALNVDFYFFKEPTGIYEYEATIDKDKITVNQYEEFIEEYNPTIKDGIYHWQE